MQPFRSNSDPITLNSPPLQGVNPELLVGLATIPCLGLILWGRTLNHWITQIGVASEEVFRGERLPVLIRPLGESNDPNQG